MRLIEVDLLALKMHIEAILWAFWRLSLLAVLSIKEAVLSSYFLHTDNDHKVTTL